MAGGLRFATVDAAAAAAVGADAADTNMYHAGLAEFLRKVLPHISAHRTAIEKQPMTLKSPFNTTLYVPKTKEKEQDAKLYYNQKTHKYADYSYYNTHTNFIYLLLNHSNIILFSPLFLIIMLRFLVLYKAISKVNIAQLLHITINYQY